jgi:hypothetical protein
MAELLCPIRVLLVSPRGNVTSPVGARARASHPPSNPPRGPMRPTLALILISSLLVGCPEGGDSGGSGGGGGQVTITFGAGRNPGEIASATPRFAFASNDDNTISQFVIASPNGQLRHNGYKIEPVP